MEQSPCHGENSFPVWSLASFDGTSLGAAAATSYRKCVGSSLQAFPDGVIFAQLRKVEAPFRDLSKTRKEPVYIPDTTSVSLDPAMNRQ